MPYNPLANLFNMGTKTTTPNNIGGNSSVVGETISPYDGRNTDYPQDWKTKSATPPSANPPIFTGAGVAAPTPPVSPETPKKDLYAKYRDPKTGEVMSPEEYAIYLGNKIPKGTGQIPNYAGDAITNPNESSERLTNRARDLNNARNDIAVGETDPYKVGNKSGIAYSPRELEAVENTYAGIYDPVLKDVFTRLEKAEAERKREQDREDEIFRTDENIRQYKATTAVSQANSRSSLGSSKAPLNILRGEDGYVNWEEYIKEAFIAEKNGDSMKDFVKDYPPTNYINPGDVDKLPSYLKPKVDTNSTSETTALMWEYLASPQAQEKTEDQLAVEIQNAGLSPRTFFPNWYSN